MTSTERDPVLGARRSARALALRRAHDVLVLDDGSEACPEPLWLRVRERVRHAARLRVVTLGTGAVGAGRGEGTDGAPAQDRGPHRAAGRPGETSGGTPAVERRVATSLPVSLVALDDTVVLVARPGRTRAVTDRDAVAALRALAESEWDRARPDGDALAPSEDTLLRLLAEGKTDTAVAVRLGVSPRTVRRHAAGLMGRLGATSRFEAGVRAAQRGWIRMTDR
ncbi:regulatory protein, luxR family [Cellulosimicrobium aquatile]|uniref:Regulatory protein, luxR family n=1 Tax=Cellulosimicrobium aquatile TaxID=1612203 RepID=A0A1N6WAI8_9MICO|nr:LuxR C-terminal-related transcriptional regulator [Cellulosimicrobium aquatile]SIQ86956.1 regulatory protein, luxR family [Cellulosimicrobium aquatile]